MKSVRSLTLRVATLSEAFLASEDERKRLGMPATNDTAMPVVVEMNLSHMDGLAASKKKFTALFAKLFPDRRPPLLLADTYYRCNLSVDEVRQLIRTDQHPDVQLKQRSIYRIWPDFKMKALIDRSVSTVKADAARRSYDASGNDIVWAVIDSGIDATHPHFRQYDTLGGEVKHLHRNFTTDADDPVPEGALTDEEGHGTHVAGIIAGGLSNPDRSRARRYKPYVGQRVSASRDSNEPDESESIQERVVAAPDRLSGVAPRCKLVSLKVLDANGNVRSTDVIRALEYIRKEVNGHGKPPLRIHGVNLSLGYDFNAKWFACGQSPVCVEVDRLVRSGVVVVIAAGNTGYGLLKSNEGDTSTGLSLTINDPGNAELAITVGSTHRDSPHTYGVSFFSSKGPTGDGRLKPDLVAPGERITSCAAGFALAELRRACEQDWRRQWSQNAAPYIDLSGTSMAAPHVSGAIAAFLSIRREFISRPEEVKRIFLQNATSLGRERYFEGRGLVDLMRAISAV